MSLSATVVVLAEKVVCESERKKDVVTLRFRVLVVPFVIKVPTSSYTEVVLLVYGEMCCRWTSEIVARSCVRSWAKVTSSGEFMYGKMCCAYMKSCVAVGREVLFGKMRHRQQR